MATPDEILQKALELHRAGNANDAARLYRQVLAAAPNNAQVLHLLGVALHQQREHAQAVDYLRRAIEIVPNQPQFHADLAMAYVGAGNGGAAIAAMRTVTQLAPEYAK